MSKYEMEARDPISPKFAFETFSKSGFSVDAAVCEIVDNSIEANATNITIKIKWKPKGHANANLRVDTFTFIDNGDGMDEKVLYDYFIATESTKRDNATGIGKFGVGAYLSCISQAKKGEVYSKTKNGKWMFTTLETNKKIPKPIEKDPPQEHVLYDHGTIIIWSDVYQDIQERVILGNGNDESLTNELGRIYRKFISDKKIVPNKTDIKNNSEATKLVDNNNKITITVDTNSSKTIVEPYDPLFYTYNRKSDDKDEIEIHRARHQVKANGKTGYMYVTITYMPDSWWADKYRPGLDPDNQIKRGINERNEGISLVREGRELYFGSYPGGPITILNASDSPTNRKYFEDRDRWVGIEIEFSRNEDEIFGVEFNKTRIRMEPYARKKISESISDTIIERRKYFSDVHNKKDNDDKKNGVDARIKRKIQGNLKQPEIDDKQKEELRKFAERFKTKAEKTEDVFNDLLKGYHISRNYESNEQGPFVSFKHSTDSILVTYNMTHPFMRKIEKTRKDIDKLFSGLENENSMKNQVNELGDQLDILIAAYGMSEKYLPDRTKEQSIQDTLEDIYSNWTKTIRRLSVDKSE